MSLGNGTMHQIRSIPRGSLPVGDPRGAYFEYFAYNLFDCIFFVVMYIMAGKFKLLRNTSNLKLQPKVRAMDICHIFLIQPFLLEGLLTEEVEQTCAWGEQHKKSCDVDCGSPMMMDITIMVDITSNCCHIIDFIVEIFLQRSKWWGRYQGLWWGRYQGFGHRCNAVSSWILYQYCILYLKLHIILVSRILRRCKSCSLARTRTDPSL